MSPQAPAPAPLGFLLSDDLIFSSRITATARALGLLIKTARSTSLLVAMTQKETPRCVIIDLAHPELALHDLLQQFQTISAHRPRVIAYGSHVDAAGLRAAREAGCDLVLPRSKFVEELPKELPAWFEVRAE